MRESVLDNVVDDGYWPCRVYYGCYKSSSYKVLSIL